MKCTTPEIAWHNRDPVFSIDIQPATNPDFFRLASGGLDTHVLIWHLKILDTGATSLEVVCDLSRHVRAVNVVRWSPCGQYLASGDDDANIIIWHQKSDDLAIMLDGENNDKENWSTFKILRGHKDDVYDICWSPDSMKLISGSIDTTAIIWDLNKGLNENILTDHKHYVQGVTWDPLGQYVATLSADRICRVYSDSGKQIKARISKGQLPVPENHSLHGQIVRYFHDDTLKTYFRRLSFSPDGNFIVTPAGYIEAELSKKVYTTYIFATNSLNQPVAYLPSCGQFTTAIKFCPVLFQLRPDGPDPVIELPYRMIFAVGTRTSIILYDTQQMKPFAIISNIHYTRLSDMTWSKCGKLLAVSSTDGYCSLVTFEENELGVEYIKEKETNEQEICEPLNDTCDEITDVSLNISMEEKKEKKPSFLEQWTKKIKTESGEKNKMDVDDDDVQIIEPEEKENKNKDNVMEKNDKIKNIVKTQEKRNTSPAKPIAVRRKPRDQMNITQFLKQPKQTETKPIVLTEDSLTREPWTHNSQENSKNDAPTSENDANKKNDAPISKNDATTNKNDAKFVSSDDSNSLKPALIVIENDSQDMKLVLEDTQPETEKMEVEESIGETEILENKNTDENESVNNTKSDSESKCDSATDETKSVGTPLKVPLVMLSPMPNKKRVPLITLSSPKHKKKPFQ